MNNGRWNCCQQFVDILVTSSLSVSLSAKPVLSPISFYVTLLGINNSISLLVSSFALHVYSFPCYPVKPTYRERVEREDQPQSLERIIE